MSVTGWPVSSALMTVHLPVPFWPAVSRILSTSGWPSSSFLAKMSRGDFDQVAVELALVPLGEDVVQFVGGEAEAVLQQVVGFADELHVAVLDAVVDHLDVVAGAVFADPVAAGRSVFDLGGDGLEDGLHVRPGGGIAAGHDGGAAARAFFAAGDAGADEENALFGQVLGAAVGVGIRASCRRR